MSNPYMTKDQFKKRRGIDLQNTDQDDTIDVVLAAATKLIESKTDRVFLPYRETKSFDAPNDTTLIIPDMQTAYSVTAFGVPLVLGEDYRKIPYYLTNEITAYSGLQRITHQFLLNWRYFAPFPGAAYTQAIVIDADWGWTATVPADILFAVGFIADRMFNSETQNSMDTGGTAQLGQSDVGSFIPKRIQDIIDDYKRKPVKYGTLQINGPNPGFENWFQQG